MAFFLMVWYFIACSTPQFFCSSSVICVGSNYLSLILGSVKENEVKGGVHHERSIVHYVERLVAYVVVFADEFEPLEELIM